MTRELADIVAEMRSLGVTTYEHQDSTTSFKVTLGDRPLPADPEVPADGTPGGPNPDPVELAQEPPEAFRRLPAAYRSLALWGGKFPNLDG